MTLDSLLAAARTGLPDTVAFRRTLHRTPEVGLQLPKTQAAILAELDGLGLQVTTGRSTTSVVAVLDGARTGPTVLLRGDMDGLPLQEDTGLDFASQNPGAMHACGHDTHVAMLAGAAKLLTARRDELAGRVVFMFQPGEEGWHGARYMIEEGVLDGVTSAFALHATTGESTGTVNIRTGAQLASSDVLRITVTGRGGHASAPHHANDPVIAAAEIAVGLQAIVTRRISAFEPAVVTVAHIVAGTTNNIIPETALLEGTIRTLSPDVQRDLHAHIRRYAAGVAAAHEATAEVDITLGYPVTLNDAEFSAYARETAGLAVGTEVVTDPAHPIMGAEDFSYVLNEVPGAIGFLGARRPEESEDEAAPNHSNRVVFDEDAMAVGVATYAAVGLRQLT